LRKQSEMKAYKVAMRWVHNFWIAVIAAFFISFLIAGLSQIERT
jgi:hypothetical protein